MTSNSSSVEVSSSPHGGGNNGGNNDDGSIVMIPNLHQNSNTNNDGSFPTAAASRNTSPSISAAKKTLKRKSLWKRLLKKGGKNYEDLNTATTAPRPSQHHQPASSHHSRGSSQSRSNGSSGNVSHPHDHGEPLSAIENPQASMTREHQHTAATADSDAFSQPSQAAASSLQSSSLLSSASSQQKPPLTILAAPPRAASAVRSRLNSRRMSRLNSSEEASRNSAGLAASTKTTMVGTKNIKNGTTTSSATSMSATPPLSKTLVGPKAAGSSHYSTTSRSTSSPFKQQQLVHPPLSPGGASSVGYKHHPGGKSVTSSSYCKGGIGSSGSMSVHTREQMTLATASMTVSTTGRSQGASAGGGTFLTRTSGGSHVSGNHNVQGGTSAGSGPSYAQQHQHPLENRNSGGGQATATTGGGARAAAPTTTPVTIGMDHPGGRGVANQDTRTIMSNNSNGNSNISFQQQQHPEWKPLQEEDWTTIADSLPVAATTTTTTPTDPSKNNNTGNFATKRNSLSSSEQGVLSGGLVNNTNNVVVSGNDGGVAASSSADRNHNTNNAIVGKGTGKGVKNKLSRRKKTGSNSMGIVGSSGSGNIGGTARNDKMMKKEGNDSTSGNAGSGNNTDGNNILGTAAHKSNNGSLLTPPQEAGAAVVGGEPQGTTSINDANNKLNITMDTANAVAPVQDDDKNKNSPGINGGNNMVSKRKNRFTMPIVEENDDAAAAAAPPSSNIYQHHDKHLYAEISIPTKKLPIKRQSSTKSYGTNATEDNVSLALSTISSLTGRSSMFAPPASECIGISIGNGIGGSSNSNGDGIVASLVGAWNEAFNSTCQCFDLGDGQPLWGGGVGGAGEGGVGAGKSTTTGAVSGKSVANTGGTVGLTITENSTVNNSKNNDAISGTPPTFSEPMLEI